MEEIRLGRFMRPRAGGIGGCTAPRVGSAACACCATNYDIFVSHGSQGSPCPVCPNDPHTQAHPSERKLEEAVTRQLAGVGAGAGAVTGAEARGAGAEARWQGGGLAGQGQGQVVAGSSRRGEVLIRGGVNPGWPLIQ